MPTLHMLVSSPPLLFLSLLSLCPYNPSSLPSMLAFTLGCFAISKARASEDWLQMTFLLPLPQTDAAEVPWVRGLENYTFNALPMGPV